MRKNKMLAGTPGDGELEFWDIYALI